jgi:arsenate reductase (glutaredoxin)
MNIVIHHNPDCGTSRNVVALVEACGYKPTIIEYLKEGWTRPQLLALFAAGGLTPRTALRETKSPAKELGLLEPGVSEHEIFGQMLAHPVLVNRPIVCTPKGVRLCRPSETVLDLLERLPEVPFLKEDGTVLDLTPHRKPASRAHLTTPVCPARRRDKS